MANVMSMKKLRNNPSRSGFDLSRKVSYTAKIGEYLVADCIECIPGDYFEGRKQHFTRTMPVNTSAYTRIREYYDWFFVPTNLLWNKSNQFFAQMQDNTLEAKSMTEDVTVGLQHPFFTSDQLGAYVSRVAHDDVYSGNIFGYNRGWQTAKLLEYLGYGNYYGYVTDDVPELTNQNNVVLNPFPLLAYQKVYQDFYRNTQWEKGSGRSCNINYMNDANQMNLPVENTPLDDENMFDVRYANWNKDFFMGVQTNSQYGDAASIDIESIVSSRPDFNINILGSSQGDNIINVNGVRLGVGTTPKKFYLDNGDLNGLLNSFSSSFTVLALRQAEALQKWKEISQSTQQDYKSQMEAHFGVHVSEAMSNRCHFVDGMVSQLDIDEVVNQNLSDQNTATIGGKGIGTGDGNFKFSTDVHGYLICIYHAQPILDYQLTGIKRQNLKSMVTDYAIPEFDRTGMVQIPFVELTNSYFEYADGGAFDLDTLFGYAPQYYEYKTRYDEVLGGFVNGGLNDWVAPFTDEYIRTYFQNVWDRYGTSDINYVFFKINPNVMNPIFVGQVNKNNYTNEFDHLLINCSFDIKAVRNLDYDGLPY